MAPLRVSPSAALRTLRMTQRQQRPFSVIARVRQLARDFEPHPFERYPTSMKAAPADWGRQFRKLGDAALFYFPGFALVLGWPLIGEAMLDGHIV
ncbi:hypothetical protein EG329_007330 [Mollisiaceae sp. DMI_Dod_QoI]|nr:hypothetical protein EG329_007330 [Helotiales sp. DMI_Dod_QoI]